MQFENRRRKWKAKSPNRRTRWRLLKLKQPNQSLQRHQHQARPSRQSCVPATSRRERTSAQPIAQTAIANPCARKSADESKRRSALDLNATTSYLRIYFFRHTIMENVPSPTLTSMTYLSILYFLLTDRKSF